uniref:Uncharacterized protein n=2 Tax=viral metagenome TaxID=1070528 RepID=A0A6M3KB88_9ZZZZ
MRMYLWEDVLCDYTCGMAVVLAKNEKQAREIMGTKFPSYIRDQLPFSECKVITEPDGFYVYGGA